LQLIDPVQWLHEQFAFSLDETTVGRELKNWARSAHGAARTVRRTNLPWRPSKKAGFAVELARVRATLLKGTPIEI
jgi:hypothetical protein